jgi:hypothetical protein
MWTRFDEEVISTIHREIKKRGHYLRLNFGMRHTRRDVEKHKNVMQILMILRNIYNIESLNYQFEASLNERDNPPVLLGLDLPLESSFLSWFKDAFFALAADERSQASGGADELRLLFRCLESCFSSCSCF